MYYSGKKDEATALNKEAIELVEVLTGKLPKPFSGRAEGMRFLMSAVQFGTGRVDDQIPIGCIEITKLTGENTLRHPAGRPLRYRCAGTKIGGDQYRPLPGDAEKGLTAVRPEGIERGNQSGISLSLPHCLEGADGHVSHQALLQESGGSCLAPPLPYRLDHRFYRGIVDSPEG